MLDNSQEKHKEPFSVSYRSQILIFQKNTSQKCLSILLAGTVFLYLYLPCWSKQRRLPSFPSNSFLNLDPKEDMD